MNLFVLGRLEGMDSISIGNNEKRTRAIADNCLDLLQVSLSLSYSIGPL
jgi:hypothetical protein